MHELRPWFVYFDLGNVLLRFDRQIACRQMAAVAGTTTDRVHQIVFQTGLQQRYERGEISSREFFDVFCKQSGTQPDFGRLLAAAGAMFELNVPIVPIAAHLSSAGYRLGIFSNTCEAHWQSVNNGRFTIIRDLFDVYALSFQLGAMKPEAAIYRAAARLAGVPPERILLVDDREENVSAAHEAGFDAVPFTTPGALAAALHTRGIRLNY